MNWQDVLTKNLIYLNLGGGRCCHPAKEYQYYIVVDQKPRGGWAVQHDLRGGIPLPDDSVDRILTEDFFEHILIDEITLLLRDCHRILKPGGLMRIGVPDYGNPKDRPFLELGKDIRYPGHITLTNFELIRGIVAESPFEDHNFYQYWEGDRYIWKHIDYSLGLIRRTPENYYRITMRSPRHKIHRFITRWRTFQHSSQSKEDSSGIRFGHPLFATELVIDLRKTR